MPIEYTVIITFITVACTVIGVSIGLGNLRRNSKLDDRNEGSQLTRVEVQLEYIAKNVNAILCDMDEIKSEMKEHRDRILIVEQTAKQARLRIDELTGRTNNKT